MIIKRHVVVLGSGPSHVLSLWASHGHHVPATRAFQAVVRPAGWRPETGPATVALQPDHRFGLLLDLFGLLGHSILDGNRRILRFRACSPSECPPPAGCDEQHRKAGENPDQHWTGLIGGRADRWSLLGLLHRRFIRTPRLLSTARQVHSPRPLA